MSDVMAFLDNIKNIQRAYHKNRIRTVLSTEVPQHILATKSIADELVKGDEGYVRNEVGFFFTEKLVNRLMHLAYLHGRDDIDERSFEAGKNKAIELMQRKLEEL